MIPGLIQNFMSNSSEFNRRYILLVICFFHFVEVGSKKMNPAIEDMANLAKSNIIPKISRVTYDKEYKKFVNWRLENNCEGNSLESQLLAYFSERLSQEGTNGSPKAPSSLWPLRSMLMTTLNVYEGQDISKIMSLKAYIKNACAGYQPKKSKVLTVSQIDQFITTADDIVWLHVKVGLDFSRFTNVA